MRYNDVYIEAMAYEVPSTIVRTSEIEARIAPLYRRMGMKPGWLEVVTGIQERRTWPEGTSLSGVGARVAREALSRSGVAPEKIGVLTSTSVCKEFLEPSTAALVQGALGLPTTCRNFDIGNACLGFIEGMFNVADRIALGHIEAGLVVASEDSREVLAATVGRLSAPGAALSEFRDHLATLTLGSGAVAMVLVNGRLRQQGHRLLGGVSRSATQHSRICIGTATGMVTDAPKLLQEGVKLAGETWRALMAEVGWRPEQVDQHVMHQVGQANHKALTKALSIPEARVPLTFPWAGNVGACGVPLTLAVSAEQGLVRPGQRVALMGIGSGLNCAMMGVEW